MNNKKILLYSGITVVCIAAIYMIGVVVGLFESPFNNRQTGLTSTERREKLINETRPTTILIYGDDINFEFQLNKVLINRIDEETISNINTEYKAVIINDLSDNVSLSTEEIEYLKTFITKDHNYLMYLGEKYSKTWDKPDQPIAEIKDNLSYEYFTINGFPVRSVGGWRTDDQVIAQTDSYFLGHSILMSIESYMREL